MAQSSIEWTGKVWNPVTGCNKKSRGCKFCYAEVMHKRLRVMQPKKYSRPFLDGAFPYEPDLFKPFGWMKPDYVFPTSMSDLFHVNVPMDYIAKCYAVMFLTPHLTYQMLTKRPERRLEIFTTDIYDFLSLIHKYANEFNHSQILGVDGVNQYSWDDIVQAFPFNNIWEGTSVENQAFANERIPLLLQTPAAVRWISAEPLVGPVDLGEANDACAAHGVDTTKSTGLDWVVTGGESGKTPQPSHPGWFLDLRNFCREAEIPFFFKQWGTWFPFTQTGESTGWKYGWIYKNGHFSVEHATMNGEVGIRTHKIGKKHSGNMLDGETIMQFPKTNNK